MSDPVTITAYEDGPLLVRGDFVLAGPDGERLAPDRRIVALCRCGYSRIKPFCDGTHKRTGFRASAAAPQAGTQGPDAVRGDPSTESDHAGLAAG